MNKQLIAKLALVAVAAGAFSAAQAAPATATFNVTMTITSSCAVTTAPTNINLGSFAATTTTLTTANGSTTFKVNCSNKTPFHIGLAPSNGNTAGAGVMSGTGSNTDKVPYTLYQDAGFTTVWGNTATTTGDGINGKGGTGAGMAGANAVSFTAYAQATNANFTPDSYTDTVTVNVNY